MKKQKVRVLNIKEGTQDGNEFLGWLLSFRYDDLLECPLETPRDFRAKKKYNKDEKRLLKLLPNVKGAAFFKFPSCCSGYRGDGSQYAETCEFFGGFGDKKENIWNFQDPQKYVICKGKKLYTLRVATCDRKDLARTVAKEKKLINLWGSACLSKVIINECKKCNYKTDNGCSFRFGCDKKGILGVFTFGCVCGDCEICPENKKKG